MDHLLVLRKRLLPTHPCPSPGFGNDRSFAIDADRDFFIASQLERKGHSPPYAKP